MLVTGSNMKDINVLKRKLANSFAMKDLGATKKKSWYENNKRQEKAQIDVVSR